MTDHPYLQNIKDFSVFSGTETEQQLSAIQINLANKLLSSNAFNQCTKPINTVAGIDVFYRDDTTVSVVVAVCDRDGKLVESVTHDRIAKFPYIPTYFAFRELPLVLDTLEAVNTHIDAYMFDGSGILHPRRMGMAAHAYLVLNKPCLGVFKNHLVGKVEEIGPKAGDKTSIILDGQELGMAVRMWKNTTPIFVSPGGGMSVRQAADLAYSFAHKAGKLPLPTFHADRLGRKLC